MRSKFLTFPVVALLTGIMAVPQMALADRDDNHNGHGNSKGYGGDSRHDRGNDDRHHYDARRDYDRDRYDKRYDHQTVIVNGPAYRVPPGRVRTYKEIVVVRPHGHWYEGYGHYHSDNEAYKWLAFTAITLKILDNLNEEAQRRHEEAQIKAASAPVGETIIWNSGNASGSVTPIRDGRSTSGRYCREFQQQIIVGGKAESAYGTACQQPDGSWEMVSTSGGY